MLIAHSNDQQTFFNLNYLLKLFLSTFIVTLKKVKHLLFFRVNTVSWKERIALNSLALALLY